MAEQQTLLKRPEFVLLYHTNAYQPGRAMFFGCQLWPAEKEIPAGYAIAKVVDKSKVPDKTPKR